LQTGTHENVDKTGIKRISKLAIKENMDYCRLKKNQPLTDGKYPKLLVQRKQITHYDGRRIQAKSVDYWKA
jgi:hypothetical protein